LSPIENEKNCMPAWYTIDKQRRLVLSAASGVFSLAADALSHHEKLTNDPDFDPRFSQIADFTQVTRFELSADDIHLLAQNGLFSANSRRALVASSKLPSGSPGCTRSCVNSQENRASTFFTLWTRLCNGFLGITPPPSGGNGALSTPPFHLM